MDNSKWEFTTLGDITDNFDSIRVPVKEADRKMGQYPYYGASGIIDMVDGYLFDGEYLLVAEDGENLRSRKTPVAFLASGKFWVNNHAHIVRGNDKANTKFLMYYLGQTDISGLLTGSTLPKLTQDNLNRIPIYAPSLPEQRAIAGVLGALDDKIELNRRMNRTLEAMARAVFREWFVEGEEVNGWYVAPLSSICENIFSGGTPSTEKHEYWNGGIPWLSSGETRERFIIDTEKTITQVGVDHSSTRFSRSGSTVIASAGQGKTRGQTSLLMFDSYINQSVVVLSANKEIISDLFLFFSLSDRYEEFRQLSDSHSSRGSLTTKLLGGLQISVPPFEMVQKFNQFVEPMVAQIRHNLQQSRTLASLRDSLLPKLMKGEVRVSEL